MGNVPLTFKKNTLLMQLILINSMLSLSFSLSLFLSLEPSWEKLCPGFYNSFLTHRRKTFLHSVIQSARKGRNVVSLFYQNDIEPIRDTEKRIKYFKMGTVLETFNAIEFLIKHK